MRQIPMYVGIMVFSIGAADAPDQVTAPSTPTAPAAAALSGDTPIETLMAKPETKALLLKYVPEIDGHGAYESFKTMSVRQLQPLAGGIITNEDIEALETDLKSVK